MSYIELQLSEIQPIVRIELKESCVVIDTVLEDLIKPALLASGYLEHTVNRIAVIDQEENNNE
jgi:hypothetical protein